MKLLIVRVCLKTLEMVVRIIAVSIPVQSMPVPVSKGSRRRQGATRVRWGEPSEVNEVAEKYEDSFGLTPQYAQKIKDHK